MLRCLKPKTWNDVLSLIILLSILTLWGLDGRGILNISGEIFGATSIAFGLVVQFYFRKAQEDKAG
jgi:hypothetical protein